MEGCPSAISSGMRGRRGQHAHGWRREGGQGCALTGTLMHPDRIGATQAGPHGRAGRGPQPRASGRRPRRGLLAWCSLTFRITLYFCRSVCRFDLDLVLRFGILPAAGGSLGLGDRERGRRGVAVGSRVDGSAQSRAAGAAVQAQQRSCFSAAVLGWRARVQLELVSGQRLGRGSTKGGSPSCAILDGIWQTGARSQGAAFFRVWFWSGSYCGWRGGRLCFCSGRPCTIQKCLATCSGNGRIRAIGQPHAADRTIPSALIPPRIELTQLWLHRPTQPGQHRVSLGGILDRAARGTPPLGV